MKAIHHRLAAMMPGSNGNAESIQRDTDVI